MSYCKLILLGNLTRDPDLKYLPNQTACCEFAVASNHKYKGNENTTFIECQAFGARAETISKYFRKGRAMLVDGRLEQQSWDARDGTKRTKYVLFVENFSFAGPPPDDSQDRQEPNAALRDATPIPSGDEIPF